MNANDFELSELTIDDLRQGLDNGRFTATSLTEQYLRRIEQLDDRLGSVIEVNPDALEIAAELDRKQGPRGPLHGVPVMVKDNLDTRDKMKTTAGSLALLDAPRPPSDAFAVAQLRKAGAVLLGKTNLSEWANMRSSDSTSGWSARRGQTNNPYALDRNPCGSSSGSGAAVSANLCSVAVGTETDGSILCPSACCGIVGIKPTVGLVSRTGIIPIGHSQDTAGPMARTVRDAAILLSAMVGVDESDEATKGSQVPTDSDYTQFLSEAGLKDARIAVARSFMGRQPTVDRIIEDALGALRDGGATLIDTDDLASTSDASEAEVTVLEYELKNDMARYLARLGEQSPMKTLADLIAFNNQHRATEMPYFGQDIFERADARGPLTDYKYIEARARCLRITRTEGIDAVMDRFGVDCIVSPTMGPSGLTDWVNGDHFIGYSTSPAAIAGYPSMTVPAGYVFGLPVGISFFGRAWTEPTLLKIAYAFEQATKIRRPPQLLETVEF